MQKLFFSSKLIGSLLCIAAMLASGCSQQPSVPDMVLKNGKIVTMDDAIPEAQAIAIAGDRIVAVGSDAKIEAMVGDNTEVIDLQGKLVIPGFIEGHGHSMGLGRAKMVLDLTQVHSWQEIVDMVAAAAQNAEPGTWIFGRGWHQEKWDSMPSKLVDSVPTHESLSAVSPDNPVYLTHASGHASFANAKALSEAGIDSDTPDPDGGTIVRDAVGNASGLLRENAQDLVSAAVSAYQKQRPAEAVEAELVKQVRLAGQEALSKGITSFHDAGASFRTIDFFKKLADEGKLPIRLYVMARGASNEEMEEKLPDYRMIGYGNHFLTVRSIKRQIDGALGSHGAWLLEPYEDMPSSTGLVLEPVDDITRTCEIAIEHGFQVNTHAIGDRANREVLDIYEKVFSEHPDKKDLRWRVEHAQHLHPDDVPRFSGLGVIASMQGVHCTSDGPWIPKRLGDQRTEEGAYVWRTLWESGAVITNGTDVPVEDISPLASYYSTVSRMMVNGEKFYPAQCLTREEALKTYTINNAYSAFEEEIKGSITPGKLADLVVLSQDIMTVPEQDIPGTEIVYTVLGGKIAYENAANR